MALRKYLPSPIGVISAIGVFLSIVLFFIHLYYYRETLYGLYRGGNIVAVTLYSAGIFIAPCPPLIEAEKVFVTSTPFDILSLNFFIYYHLWHSLRAYAECYAEVTAEL